MIIIIFTACFTCFTCFSCCVFAQFPPDPDPGCHPITNGLPSTSKSIIFETVIQDYIAAAVTCSQSSSIKEIITCVHNCNFDALSSPNIIMNVSKYQMVKVPANVSSDIYSHKGTCCSGIRDIKGNIYDEITFYCTAPGLVAGTLLLDTRFEAFQGATLREEDYWSLVTQSITPANQSHTTYVKETYGVQQNQAYLLSDSNGVSTTSSWNNNFGGYTNEMSHRLTKAYFHSVEIDMSVSINQGYSFRSMNETQADGVYQLVQDYQTLMPKTAEDKLKYYNDSFRRQCASGAGACYQLSYSVPYHYQSRTFFQLVGTENDTNC